LSVQVYEESRRNGGRAGPCYGVFCQEGLMGNFDYMPVWSGLRVYAMTFGVFSAATEPFDAPGLPAIRVPWRGAHRDVFIPSQKREKRSRPISETVASKATRDLPDRLR